MVVTQRGKSKGDSMRVPALCGVNGRHACGCGDAHIRQFCITVRVLCFDGHRHPAHCASSAATGASVAAPGIERGPAERQLAPRLDPGGAQRRSRAAWSCRPPAHRTARGPARPGPGPLNKQVKLPLLRLAIQQHARTISHPSTRRQPGRHSRSQGREGRSSRRIVECHVGEMLQALRGRRSEPPCPRSRSSTGEVPVLRGEVCLGQVRE